MIGKMGSGECKRRGILFESSASVAKAIVVAVGMQAPAAKSLLPHWRSAKAALKMSDICLGGKKGMDSDGACDQGGKSG